MKYNDNGLWKTLNVKVSDTYPIGAIAPYGGATAPTNWLICDGSAVSRTTYADLFSIIGTSFGSGDGSTTFNLPDLRSRVPLGKDSRDEDFDTIGETYGEKKHTLTIEEIPSHNHIIRRDFEGSGFAIPYYEQNTNWRLSDTQGADTVGTSIVGDNQPHNIVQPSLVTNYIIKAFQSAGFVGNVTNNKNNSTEDAYSCSYINNKMYGVGTYSTDEIRVGTWIDGKPIYRKVLDLGSINWENGDKVFNHNITNLDCMIDIKWIGYYQLTSSWYTKWDSINAHNWTASSTQIKLHSSSDSNFFKNYLILEYTKND